MSKLSNGLAKIVRQHATTIEQLRGHDYSEADKAWVETNCAWLAASAERLAKEIVECDERYKGRP